MIVLRGAADALWRCKRDLAREMGDRAGVVVVGARESGNSPLFAYTGNRAAAEAATQVAQEVVDRHRVTHWVVHQYLVQEPGEAETGAA